MAADEFSLIGQFFSHLDSGKTVDLGVGDDCAILRFDPGERLATSVDTQVEGVHFPVTAPAEDVAWRVVAAAVSDLAAMGAEPRGMTLSLTLPQPDEHWLQAFSAGLSDFCRTFNIPLVGGDITRGPLTIGVQVMGALPVDRALLRRGAGVGDKILVSGTLGDAAAALAWMCGQWQPQSAEEDFLYQRFYRPQPRVALGLSLQGVASAAIDISDGLLADAGHIASASGVKLFIDTNRLPMSPALASCSEPGQALAWALSGGDDYELCFTQPSELPIPKGCTVIGEVRHGEGVECDRNIDSRDGYRHF